jgi:hypothetical protein
VTSSKLLAVLVGTPSSEPDLPIGAEGDVAVSPAAVRQTRASFGAPEALVEISGEAHTSCSVICVGIRSGGGLIGCALAHPIVSPELAPFEINGRQASDPDPKRFWPILQHDKEFRLENQLSGRTHAAVPVPAAGTFPGFTVKVTQST